MDKQLQTPTLEFCVVVNDEEQYSVWPRTRSLPLGWTECNPTFQGSKDACLAHVGRVWDDIRPKSMREGAAC